MVSNHIIGVTMRLLFVPSLARFTGNSGWYEFSLFFLIRQFILARVNASIPSLIWICGVAPISKCKVIRIRATIMMPNTLEIVPVRPLAGPPLTSMSAHSLSYTFITLIVSRSRSKEKYKGSHPVVYWLPLFKDVVFMHSVCTRWQEPDQNIKWRRMRSGRFSGLGRLQSNDFERFFSSDRYSKLCNKSFSSVLDLVKGISNAKEIRSSFQSTFRWFADPRVKVFRNKIGREPNLTDFSKKVGQLR